MMAEKMLTVKEVAQAISVSEWAVRQWVSKGQVPGAVKFGNTIRIPESFLTSGTAEENAAADEAEQDGDSTPTVPSGLDSDPRDQWAPEEPVEVGEAPEPIEPPADEEEAEEE